MRKFLVLMRGLRWLFVTKWRWTAGALVVVLVAGFVGWRVHRRDDRTATTPLTVTVSSGTQRQTVSASGTIEPARTADLDFSVSGTVTHVYVKAGQHVVKGQRLAAVDPTSLTAARSAARASYAAAVSQQSQDTADGASAVQLASDQASIVAAKASLDSAEQDVADAVLRATITGTVTAQNLTVGDVVGSGSGSGGVSAASDSSSSSAEVSLASSKAFVVDATVAATDAASVKDGMQAQITATGDDSTIYGTVASIGLVAQTDDEGAAVFPVTIDVTGAQTGLYAGTSATASIIVKQVPNVLTVLSRAIQSSKGGTYVEKVVDGKTVRTPVKIGTVYGATTQILSGLKAGDEVEIPGFSLPTAVSGSSGFRSRLGGFGGSGFSGSFGTFPGGSFTGTGGLGGSSLGGGQ